MKEDFNHEFYRNAGMARHRRLGGRCWSEAWTIFAVALIAGIVFAVTFEALRVFAQVDGAHSVWPFAWVTLVFGYWAGRRDMRDELTKEF